MTTFIVDCPYCRAKVAAEQKGVAEQTGFNHDESYPYGERLYVGECPRCKTLLAGQSTQLDFEDFDAEDDRWSDVVRVFPKPSKTFSSHRIPRALTDSLIEADRSMQANANIAACVMFGRALEAMCRDILLSGEERSTKRLMLASGIKELREKKVIDDRLYDWSQDLHAFRNLAAHPEDISITKQDAEDLQTFVYAITEYVYDLSDRYAEFKRRKDSREKVKK